jgi:hypothetical protein
MAETEHVRAFILQSTCRVESGLPVIHLHGKLETNHGSEDGACDSCADR